MDILKKVLPNLNAMGRTASNDPLQKFKFRVTIPGVPTAVGFQKASALSNEVEVVEYREGGYGHTAKLPGQAKVPEVTLERGTFADSNFEELFKQTVTDPDFRTTVTIELMDKEGNTKKIWNLAEAWVSKWEGSDLDASSSDVAIEKITIQFEHYLD